MIFDEKLTTWVFENIQYGEPALVQALVTEAGYLPRIAKRIVSSVLLLGANNSNLDNIALREKLLPRIDSPAPRFVESLPNARISFEMLAPNIVHIENFVTSDELTLLRAEGDNFIDETDYDGIRNNGLQCLYTFERPISLLIRNRLASVFNWDPLSIEHPELLRYRKGQQFKLHTDYAKDDTSSRRRDNQPVATALLYVAEADIGGSTYFGNLGIRFQPKPGDLVFFSYPATEDSGSLHAGEEVLRGEKILLATIFREFPLPSWYHVKSVMSAYELGLLDYGAKV
jgi:hypothetical protein